MVMPLLSVCTIFKDEERFLPDFLDSLACLNDLVDHHTLVLVDTGSHDRSPEILRERGLSFFSFAWVQDFSAARNFSLKQAKGDWILVLDVDDRIPEKTIKELIPVLANTKADAFYLSYISVNSLDWKAQKVPIKDVQARLMVFRNHKGYHYKNPVHETIDAVIQEARGKIETLDLPVYHLGYVDELCAMKDERNAEIIRVNFERDPKNPDFAFNYTTLIWSGEAQVYKLLSESYPRAETALRYAIAERALAWMDEFGPPPPTLKTNEIDWEQALLEINPQAAFVFLRRARNYFQQGERNASRDAYEKVRQRLGYEALRPEVFGEVLDRLGVLYAMEGRLGEAMTCFQALESRQGRSPGTYHQILKLLFARKDYAGFISEILAFPKDLTALSEAKRRELLSLLETLNFQGKDDIREKFMNKSAL
jgi:hypothetical protein